MVVRPFNPDRQQRIAAISHIVYEYANFLAAGHYSIHGQAPWRTNCDDAFLLGCRKLEEFLLKKERTRKYDQELDDVLALDYLPTNARRDWELPIWASWRDAMNKQLAHIAYSREKEWNHLEWVPKLLAEFKKAWRDFRNAITDKDYSDEFDSQLRKCRDKQGFENIDLEHW